MQFILGMVIGAALLGLVLWIQRKGITLKWYEWLLAGLGFVMLVWTVYDFFGSMAEHNETAGRVLLLILGIPAVVLLGLSAFLPWWRINRASKKSPAGDVEKPSTAN